MFTQAGTDCPLSGGERTLNDSVDEKITGRSAHSPQHGQCYFISHGLVAVSVWSYQTYKGLKSTPNTEQSMQLGGRQIFNLSTKSGG